jgi:transcription initiation factor TFIIIB Brf1 subunit/transcription initiation factor TFIIB
MNRRVYLSRRSFMDAAQLASVLEVEVKKAQVDLKAKKMLLKRVKKGNKASFIETKLGRALNHALAFITYPCAVTHHNARMRLDNPKTYRAEKQLRKADKLVKRCEETSASAGKRAAKLALKAVLMDAALAEYETIPEVSDRVRMVRASLVREAKRLGIPQVQDGQGMGIDDLIAGLGMKPAAAGA